jgi:hypothetical protein
MKTNPYIIFVVRHLGKYPSGKPKQKWTGKNRLDFRGTDCEFVSQSEPNENCTSAFYNFEF